MTTSRPILLVEDNPDDELLTLRALKQNNIPNQVTVAHDGAEALEYLFSAGGSSSGGSSSSVTPPGLILLDLKPRRSAGWRCCAGYGLTNGPGSSPLSS